MFGGAAGVTGASITSSSIAASAFDAFGAGPTGATSVTTTGAGFTGMGAGFTGGSIQQQPQQQVQQRAGGIGGYDLSSDQTPTAANGSEGRTGPDLPASSDWTLVSGGPTGGSTAAAGFTGGSGITAGSGPLPDNMFGGGGDDIALQNGMAADAVFCGAASQQMHVPLQAQEQQQHGFSEFGASPPQGFATNFNSTTPPSGAVQGGGEADLFSSAQQQKMMTFASPAGQQKPTLHRGAQPGTIDDPFAGGNTTTNTGKDPFAGGNTITADDPFGGGNATWAAF